LEKKQVCLTELTQSHRRTSLVGYCPAPSRAKPLFFGQMLNFFVQKPAAKNEKNVFINPKPESIPSSEMKCPKSWIFTSNYWVGWVGQSNFEGSHQQLGPIDSIASVGTRQTPWYTSKLYCCDWWRRFNDTSRSISISTISQCGWSRGSGELTTLPQTP